MKKWWRLLLLFVAVYLVALAATLPMAQLMRWGGPALAQQQVQLAGIDGTLWTGRAAQVVVRGVALGEMKWELSPWKIVLGRIEAHLELTGDDTNVTTRLSWKMGSHRWQLEQLEGRLPATLIKALTPRLPAVPTGDITMAVSQAQFDAMRLSSLEGKAIWNKGGISSPMAIAMGDLVAEFKTESNTINGHIHDTGGPLQLDSQLNLMPDGSYRLNGKASVRAGANPALATSLSLLGQPDGKGETTFHFAGRLP